MDKIKVMIIDEHPLFCEGVRWTLEQEGDFDVVGKAASSHTGMEMAKALVPDVVLLDVNLATGDALEVARQIRHNSPRTAVIILTAYEDEEQLFQSIKVGAAAYHLKDIHPDELVAVVRRVSVGDYLINDDVLAKPDLASRVLKSFRELADDTEVVPLFTPLSGREVEILDYIARGNSNKEIAKALHISDQTVKNHITSILKKLAVNDRTQAVVYALRHGWIKMQDT